VSEFIWLDAQTVSYVSSGDTTLESELLTMYVGGSRFLIVPKVHEELMVGNPFDKPHDNNTAIKPIPPERAEALRSAMLRLKIEVDRAGTGTDRLGDNQTTCATAPNCAVAPPPQFGDGKDTKPGLIDQGWHVKESRQRVKGEDGKKQTVITTKTVSVTSEDDAIVMAQIAASARARGVTRPRVFSCDGGVKTNAPKFGLTPITRTSVPPPRQIPGRGPMVPPLGGRGNPGPLGSLIGGAHTYIRDGLAKYSRQKACGQALEEYERRKPEVEELLTGNRGSGVRVMFYFQVAPGVNPDFPERWKYEGMTIASSDAGVQGVLAKPLPRGEIDTVVLTIPALPKEAGPPRTAGVPLTGMWAVKIGAWNGYFEFRAGGPAAWAETPMSVRHNGQWQEVDEYICWHFFDDPKDLTRLFTARLPVQQSMDGQILPVGQGFFTMTKLS
jgi:hypothetical protein